MKKLKILYIDIEGGFGGSSRSLLNMILGLNKDIFEPVVICKKNGPTHKKLNSLGFKLELWSGPLDFLFKVKCFSIMFAPSATAARELSNP